LKSLRIQVNKLSDFKRVDQWIVCCILLHNVLNGMNDAWDEIDEEDNKATDEELRILTTEQTTELNMRVKVQNILLQWYSMKHC
jgi:hypothetical protein